jgi:hypothetical protein
MIERRGINAGSLSAKNIKSGQGHYAIVQDTGRYFAFIYVYQVPINLSFIINGWMDN